MQSAINLINLTEIAKKLLHDNSDQRFLGKGMTGIGEILLGKKTPSLQDLSQEEKAIVANNSFVQLSYPLNNPVVVFVKDSSTLELVESFSELPRLQLNEEQQAKVDAFLEKSKNNPKFYNGDHFAAKNILYDAVKNFVYIEAKATDYATMSAVPGVFTGDFFRLGVISPIITTDRKTYLLERNDLLKLLSSLGGFIQPIDGSLNNLVVSTAGKEAVEEMLGTPSGEARISFNTLINQVSFRALHSSKDNPSIQIPTFELIAPVFVDCTSEAFKEEFLDKNCAKDRMEHRVISSEMIDGVEYVQNKHEGVDLSSLNSILEALYSNKPGKFLYCPLITSALQAVNIDIINQDGFEEITKVAAEELAERLLNTSHQYHLTKETPHLSAIVRRILETQPVERQKQVLNEEIVQAALDKKDEHYEAIYNKWYKTFGENYSIDESTWSGHTTSSQEQNNSMSK